MDPLFLGDAIALHALDMSSEHSLRLQVRSDNPLEVWNASCGSRIAVFGIPWITQVGEGDKWENESRTDRFAARQIKVHF